MAWVVEVPPAETRSALPAGGSPATDREYAAWRAQVLDRAAQRDLASRWHDAAESPPALHPWAFDARLFAELGGRLPVFAGDPVIYNHRTRFLGVCLRDRRRDVVRAAARFVAEATDGL